MAKVKSVIEVGGMSCEHCVKAVTDAVKALNGVSRVEVSLKKNNAVAEYDDAVVSLGAIKGAIKEEGYEV